MENYLDSTVDRKFFITEIEIFERKTCSPSLQFLSFLFASESIFIFTHCLVVYLYIPISHVFHLTVRIKFVRINLVALWESGSLSLSLVSFQRPPRKLLKSPRRNPVIFRRYNLRDRIRFLISPIFLFTLCELASFSTLKSEKSVRV